MSYDQADQEAIRAGLVSGKGPEPGMTDEPDQLDSAGRTDVGRVRKHNEDNLVVRPEAGLWAVADGMGGMASGARASGLIRERLEALSLPNDLSLCVEIVCNALESANAELREELGGAAGGSTVVVLIVRGFRFACIWAGDSRLYRLDGERLERVSKDHSVVEQLVDAGAIKPEAAMYHPLSNRITRAVGTEPQLKLDVVRGRVRSGERFILSSDGLHGLVPPATISKLACEDGPAEVVDRLVAAALDAGGKDNITVVLVDLPERDLDATAH